MNDWVREFARAPLQELRRSSTLSTAGSFSWGPRHDSSTLLDERCLDFRQQRDGHFVLGLTLSAFELPEAASA